MISDTEAQQAHAMIESLESHIQALEDKLYEAIDRIGRVEEDTDRLAASVKGEAADMREEFAEFVSECG